MISHNNALKRLSSSWSREYYRSKQGTQGPRSQLVPLCSNRPIVNLSFHRIGHETIPCINCLS